MWQGNWRLFSSLSLPFLIIYLHHGVSLWIAMYGFGRLRIGSSSIVYRESQNIIAVRPSTLIMNGVLVRWPAQEYHGLFAICSSRRKWKCFSIARDKFCINIVLLGKIDFFDKIHTVCLDIRTCKSRLLLIHSQIIIICTKTDAS